MSKKEEGLTGIVNSVVIAKGDGGIKGLNDNGKNMIKIKLE